MLAADGWGRRALLVLWAWVMVPGSLSIFAVTPAHADTGEAELPEWFTDLELSDPTGWPDAPPWPEVDPPPLIESEGVARAVAEFPDPGVFHITLEQTPGGDPDVSGLLETAESSGKTSASVAGPIAIALSHRAESDRPTGRKATAPALRVQVLGQEPAQRVGVAGFVFRVAGVNERLVTLEDQGGLPVNLAVDYSAFGDAFGAGYADRLRVLALPGCAVEGSAGSAECDVAGEAVELPSRNDAQLSHLLVENADLAKLAAQPALAVDPESVAGPGGMGSSAESSSEAGFLDLRASAEADGGVLLAVTSSQSGATGNFAATPLSLTGGWQVTPGTGEFNWSYPIELPDPPAGDAPPLGLSYSSGSVDGMVSSRNTQGHANGMGWSDFASAAVERRYRPCSQTTGAIQTNDLCWASDNATISLNGVSSELVKVSGSGDVTEWRLQADPGWRVERRHRNDGVGNADNNNEYWKVTTPDGTQYFFGFGRDPDTGASPSSVWTVPVFANQPGDQCWGGSGPGVCNNQAWRWNLDRVVDANGNVTTYQYARETNRYRPLNGLGGDTSEPYHRGGGLIKIEYGKVAGTATTPAARVLFGRQNRCNQLNESCPAATPSNGSLFPDVPNDLLCSSNNCLVTAPTFFETKRYSHVRSEVRVGSEWRSVEQYNIAHSLLANSDGDTKLYLVGIQRVGLAQSSLLPLPPVTLWHIEKPNRVDVNLSQGRKPMGHFRVGIIDSEFGGRTWVQYGQQRSCSASYSGPWDVNQRDCFPQKLTSSQTGVFHKWLVTEVTDADKTEASPSQRTTYNYIGTPALRKITDPFIKPADRLWSDWRGYETVTIGQAGTQLRLQLFRGMHGDKLANGSSRQVSVTPFTGAGFDNVAPVADEPWLAGTVLTTAALGSSGQMLEATHHTYESRVTAQPGTDPTTWAVWIGDRQVTESLATDQTGADFRQRRSTITYTSLRQPSSYEEEGWLDEQGDERCAITTYANNANAWLLEYPASIVSFAGRCTSIGGPRSSASTIYYDGSTTLGEAPTRGNVTSVWTQLDAETWVEATTTYDSLGRAISTTDPKGRTTTTTFETTPTGGYPRTSTVINHLGHEAVAEWLPEYGVPLKETDPNGNVTTYGYDGLGRVLWVKRPTEQAGTAPVSWEFAYQIASNRDKPAIVRTRELQSTNPTRYVDAWVVYDGHLRERQTHALSPTPGKVVVSETTYNERGLVRDEVTEQAATGTAGVGLLSFSAQNRVRTSYDELNRPVRQAWWRGGSEAWASVTSYAATTETTESPEGQKTRTVFDGLGRQVAVEEFDGERWQTTTSQYDLADRLVAVTDPVGNTIRYSYNMVGWRLSEDDPDTGQATFDYDAAGNVTKVTDPEGSTIHTSYDAVDRPVERRKDSPDGTLLATWSYDAPGEAGLLDKSVRISAEGDWVTDVEGYDKRGRPLGTTLIVPEGIAGLAGSYTVTQTYDRADNVTSISYPAIGGLPAETVQTRFNTVGAPDFMSGLEDYVWSARYDDRGRESVFLFGPPVDGQPWMATQWTYDQDQRLQRLQTVIADATPDPVVSDHSFTFDRDENLVSRTSRIGGQQWRECFTYDLLNRLTNAHTVKVDQQCGQAPPGGGDQPYDHSYRYSPDGRLLERVENGEETVYRYPDDGRRPHAPTRVGDDAYQWDPLGRLIERTVDGDPNTTETLEWDPEGRLASVEDADGKTTSFVYDAEGQRLLRTTPDGSTLSFGDHEIHTNTDGSVVTAVRTYSFDGEPVATRHTGGVDYLLTNEQGSIEGTARTDSDTLAASRSYHPYGSVRSHRGDEFATDRGFSGEIEDDTGLSYLNARYYDAGIGLFISPDPLLIEGESQTVNPYAYARNNPTNFSDADGQLARRELWSLRTNTRRANSAYSARLTGQARAHQARVSAIRRNQAGLRQLWTARAKFARQQKVIRAARSAKAWSARLTGQARAHRTRVLKALHRANPNPNFWKALSQAGSGAELRRIANNLTLKKMHAANPNSGFWRALNAVGAKRLRAIAAGIQRQRHAEHERRLAEASIAISGSGGGGGGFIDAVKDTVGGAIVRPLNNHIAKPIARGAVWLYQHTEIGGGFCVGICVGGAQQGGRITPLTGTGCCFAGVNVGISTNTVDNRACTQLVGTSPVRSHGPVGVGIYGTGGANADGKPDNSLGISLGAGGGGAIVTCN